MCVTIEVAYDKKDEIRDLFTQYTNLLIENDSTFKEYLALQNYDDEISNLKEKYGAPKGRLYLASVAGETAGCIGLKPLDEKRCEMKRLFVKPQFRGRKIAEQLVKTIIEDAKEIGYKEMYLDTLPFLKGAILLYEKLGFIETDCYNNSPIENTIYMKLTLKNNQRN